MNKEKKDFLKFLFIFSALALASFGILFIPNALSAREALTSLKNEKTFLEDIEKYKKQLDLLREKLDFGNADIKSINERLVSYDDLINVLVLLDDLSEKNSVSHDISLIKQSQNNQTAAFKNVIKGDFPNILRYIKGIENLKYVIKIENCAIFRDAGGQTKAEMILDIPIYN